jgi:putative tricarboxylic transport membrane protein
MARQGRAGPALAAAAIGSFIAGTVATVVLAVAAPPLADVALRFGPADYFALVLFGLVVSIALARGSALKALAMIALGVLLGTVGQDIYTGTPRFVLGQRELYGGIDFVSVAVGMFGIAEILRNLEDEQTRELVTKKVKDLWPTREDFRRITGPILRGTVLGSALGILPGAGHVLASFGSYSIEKRLSKRKSEFGHGAIEGVAGPESANNAASTGSFVPMLALGLPTGPVTAVLMAALLIHGVPPGPQLVTEHPQVFWGFIASMYVGNLMLLALNLPLVGMFVNVLRIPYAYLYPLIIMFCIIGVYEVNHSIIDVWIMLVMGIVGYLLRKFDFDPAPLVLGLVIAPALEMSLRQSLIMSNGSWSIFYGRPIAGVLLAVSAGLLVLAAISFVMKRKDWRDKLAEIEVPDKP